MMSLVNEPPNTGHQNSVSNYQIAGMVALMIGPSVTTIQGMSSVIGLLTLVVKMVIGLSMITIKMASPITRLLALVARMMSLTIGPPTTAAPAIESLAPTAQPTQTSDLATKWWEGKTLCIFVKCLSIFKGF